ncbi:glycosyltransferase family 4 protein [Desulfofustis glycolicus]|uniref:Glycosyltransferase involved in cell wall bisynthesis n=1 Tax=Desulfofustis glycolicus DSM 9705 TaxID=1121409 RepID=A0A1M5WHY5_9BACT|nr:glycosyltransferase family 4 protein [Desulfofustis glycolicus]MCB2216841.1 glycosyltransferase family 4 protein [Desulfobulbaceae bacterium]SHH87169.1 Glycosyltransferase involved in cell wall bisynthesis [Desulfofustis glycolicus DSM 9705]
MKILMVIERYLPIWGGAENQLQQLATRLSTAGCEISIVTRRFSADLSKEESLAGLSVRRVGVPGRGWISELLFIAGLAMFSFRKAGSFDIIHSHGALKMGAVVSFIALALRKKGIAKIATAGHGARLDGAWYRPVVLFFFRRIHAIIAISTEIEEEMRQMAIDHAKIVRIPNGVDCSRFTAMETQQRIDFRSRMGFAQTDVLVLFVGRLVRRKGLDLLLRCWPRLSRRDNLHLLIVGSGENQEDSIEQEMKEVIKRDSLRNIHFLGEVTNPENYVPSADVFIFPSRLEGFPNVLLEAMASGVPVAASAIGGTVDLIEDGRNGLLFNRDDARHLIDQVNVLIDDAELRGRLGKNGQAAVRQKYAFKIITQQYLDLYRRLNA